MKTNLSSNYASHTKDELFAEVQLRELEGITAATLKDDMVAALELSDDQADDLEPEQPKAPLPELKASPIPQVAEIPVVSDVTTGGTPKDEDYTDGNFVMVDGDWKGEEFALCIHEEDTYGRTHSAKNSLHFWQGKEADFRKTFEKK